MTLLAVLTVLLVLLVMAVLWVALKRISDLLQAIGGPSTSFPGTLLARIRWGVRAIERQSDALAPQAARLAERLPAIEAALDALERRGGALRQGAEG